MCNDELITLTNTSENLNTGGSFQWNIEDVENIDENGSDITFTFRRWYLLCTWVLTYTNPSGECISSDSLIQNINVDLITADFTVDNTVICDSEGTISLESTSLIDSDGTFTYSWSVGESLLGEETYLHLLHTLFLHPALIM